MLTVLLWKWGNKFGPHFVNRTRAMLARNLHIDHEVVCVTDNAYGIDHRVRVERLPDRFRDTPRCRRRMQQYDLAFLKQIGATRILSLDLDVVIVDDLTPLVDRPDDPLVLWRVGYADVYSGSFVLYDAGELHEMWREFEADPEGYPRRASKTGIPSDQAMLNHFLRNEDDIAHWTDRDGFVVYFGRGYEGFVGQGVGPSRPVLPPGARLVVFGSDDIPAMESGAFPWVTKHWRE